MSGLAVVSVEGLVALIAVSDGAELVIFVATTYDCLRPVPEGGLTGDGLPKL